MDALRADSGDAIVLVTPAFPETGRTVYHGQSVRRLGAAERKPAEGPSAQPDARFQPGAGAGAPEQDQGRVWSSLQLWREAPMPFAGVSPSSRRTVFGAAVIDAVFDRDLETIGGVALDHRLSVGASGIGLGLARALVASGKVKSNAAATVSESAIGGPAACLAGSCSQATLQQIANAEKTMPVLHLDPEQVIAGPDEVRRALAWASERISKGPVLIASSSTPDQVQALQSRHGRDAAGHAIEQAMADIAEGLVRSGVRRLVVAGGETSGAVVDRLRHSRIPRWRGNRCRRAGFARGRRKRRCDAACTEIGQFRWRGIFLRRAEADALIASRSSFPGEVCRVP